MASLASCTGQAAAQKAAEQLEERRVALAELGLVRGWTKWWIFVVKPWEKPWEIKTIWEKHMGKKRDGKKLWKKKTICEKHIEQ